MLFTVYLSLHDDSNSSGNANKWIPRPVYSATPDGLSQDRLILQEVARREAALAAQGAGTVDPMLIKNFPSCCPMVHHDIVNDIPEYNKAITRACVLVQAVCPLSRPRSQPFMA
jgi:hypothetical protein